MRFLPPLTDARRRDAELRASPPVCRTRRVDEGAWSHRVPHAPGLDYVLPRLVLLASLVAAGCDGEPCEIRFDSLPECWRCGPGQIQATVATYDVTFARAT